MDNQLKHLQIARLVLLFTFGVYIGVLLGGTKTTVKKFQNNCKQQATLSNAWSYAAYPDRCVLVYGTNIMSYTR